MRTATGTFQFPSVIPGILFSKEVEAGRNDKDESNTIDFFFKKWHIYVHVRVCVCSVCYFVMIPIIFFPPKSTVMFSPEGAPRPLWVSQCYVVGDCHGEGLSLLLPFSQGNLSKQSLQQQTPLTLIISGLDENTIFCRLWLKGENY